MESLRKFLFGGRKDFRDPGIFHRMALIPFLAWVGLGADGLSSSSYGPEEAFKALGEHTYLAVGLAVATALTVIVISASYSQIIEHFPYGGGGYVVATRLLGEKWGVVSGCALLVDYVLTITTSIASGADALFSMPFIPQTWLGYKLTVEVLLIGLLVVTNIRGVKESVVVLMPIFILFLITHAILIGWGVGSNARELPTVAREVQDGFRNGLGTLGGLGMLLLFLRAYSLGGGTFTGIEAVSNGLAIMRDPKVETGKRTMLYMAISLSITAGGILISYLLLGLDSHGVPGKTMNAVLAERLASHWHIGPMPIGEVFIITTLICEGALLFVAAQAGFIDGPRVMANMATDSWLPHRFSALSDRLTTQNGVLLMGGAAVCALLYTGGSVSRLVVMYSINVFVTFSLSQLGMVRYWIRDRKVHKDWWRHLPINAIGLVMCASILVITVLEKFKEGGYLTLIITAIAVTLCIFIRRHYNAVRRSLSHLDKLFANLPFDPKREELGPTDPSKPTAVLLVGGYGGLGVHSLLTLIRMFPKQFCNIVFVSVGLIDSSTFKGAQEVEEVRARTKDSVGKYVGLARRLGFAAEYRMAVGTDVVEEASKLCLDVAKDFPQVMYFSGKLIFEERRWYHKILHNETAYSIQHRLQFAGHAMVILPVRVRARELQEVTHSSSNKDEAA
jgi:amino acid transporter